MAATGSTSDIVSLNSIEFGTAWHFLPVLIRQGSSARLVELAFRSALAPDLVEILCRILGSPLKFISGGFISSSDAVVEAFVEFMTRTVSWYVPRDAFRVVGLRRGTCNVSLKYMRKRKAPSLDNAAVSLSSSKRRTLLTHERGEGEPMKVEGLPKLLYHLNEIPEKENFDVSSGIDQHSVGMNAFDCGAVELDQSNNLHVSLHDLSCFASRNISYAKEEDTRESNPYITNSVFPYKKVVDFSYEQISLDVGLDANIINEEALQRVTMVEPDFKPILDQSSQVNLTLREDCTTLSIELGFNVDIPELHVFERLNAIELDFETSLMDRVLNHTAVQQLDHNAQSASSPLACSNQPVLEAIDERSLHSTDDKLITGQLETKETAVDSGSAYFHRKETAILTYEFGDVHKNSAEIEDKQKTFSESSIKDHIASVGLQNLVGPNIANNNISSTKKQDRNFDDGLIAKQRVKNVCDVNTPKERVDVFTKATKNSSDQKLMPNFKQIDHNAQSASSPLACSNQLALEAISERNLHSTDDKLITGQLETKETLVDSGSAYFHRKETAILAYEFGDVHKNSAAIEFMLRPILTDEPADVAEEKQKTFSEPSIKDHIASVGLQNLVGSNIANNNISSTKKQDRNFDDCLIAKKRLKNVCNVNTPSKERVDAFTKAAKNFSDQKLMPNFKQIDHNAQSASSPLACSNQLVLEAINERNLHCTDDKLITGQLETKEKPVDSGSAYFHRKETAILSYEFGDLHKNSAAIEFMLRPILTVEPADVAEDKQKTFSEPSIKDHIASVGLQNLVEPNIANNNISSTQKQDRNFDDGLIAKQRVKNVCNVNTPSKERMDAFTKATKNSSDQKLMPNFESFIIEEEEGSGGYGTVYKAHRKEDGKVFAVKCPHANANSHHVYNELKMLERFGGRNFVIKYECSFKNGDSECFVLEHVEHDRPEILKKEISLFELQWYGFCMFRALASLHKQGVVHRDVKPGNFLFSRKVNKGYLIDFNLASDLQQKFCRSSKRKTPSATVNPNSLPETKSTSIIHSRKFIDRDLLENAKKETADESKKVVTSKSSKKKAHKGDMGGFPTVERSKHGSQTADGSGVTSTKDQTSTKTPLDWLKQPIPYKGRKELINFVHKAMHNPQNLKTVSNGPSSQRKRIAAPMTKTDTRLLILTPMPLHSGGNAVAGAGMFKNKASGKVKREGPCVGTKGFRAPEVLFKSFHQGCKIDIWSAGVTMLYLMIGRAPFGGDPEQNIKEIAKLRGSEDLWEVAKLHNCESSFPVDLLEVGSLKSMELSDWCGKNSRRVEFHELIPESLFDLVDKCLAVNPRRRFSAEEALMHRFFSPCHESIRKQRLLRKVATEKP